MAPHISTTLAFSAAKRAAAQHHGGDERERRAPDMRCQPRMSDAMSRTEKLVVTETSMTGMTPTKAKARDEFRVGVESQEL